MIGIKGIRWKHKRLGTNSQNNNYNPDINHWLHGVSATSEAIEV